MEKAFIFKAPLEDKIMTKGIMDFFCGVVNSYFKGKKLAGSRLVTGRGSRYTSGNTVNGQDSKVERAKSSHFYLFK
jgi:hypothetical protein